MAPETGTADARERLSTRQREALWTWTWLGWRDSTPAFKASLVLAALALAGILAYALVPR